MREIKFRAWDKYNNMMIENIQNNTFIPAISGPGITYHFDNYLNDDNYEIMQYTGLLDKNGKEIYEGDIIDFTWFYYGEIEVEIEKKGIIKNNGLAFTFNVKDDEYALDNLEFDSESDIEVIGNIYENPELNLFPDGFDPGNPKTLKEDMEENHEM